MAKHCIFIQIDLGIKCKELSISSHDQWVDLAYLTVITSEQTVQPLYDFSSMIE